MLKEKVQLKLRDVRFAMVAGAAHPLAGLLPDPMPRLGCCRLLHADPEVVALDS